MAPGMDTVFADGALQWPLPIAGTITSPQGYRTDPVTGEISYHSGTDIAAPEGTPILAAADGTVTIANATDSWGGSYGYYVKIDHGGGLTTLCIPIAPVFVLQWAGRCWRGKSLPMLARQEERQGLICILKYNKTNDEREY